MQDLDRDDFRTDSNWDIYEYLEGGSRECAREPGQGAGGAGSGVGTGGNGAGGGSVGVGGNFGFWFWCWACFYLICFGFQITKSAWS